MNTPNKHISVVVDVDGKAIRLSVDFELLARTLGRKAIRNKTGEAKAMYGAVSAEVVKVAENETHLCCR